MLTIKGELCYFFAMGAKNLAPVFPNTSSVYNGSTKQIVLPQTPAPKMLPY